MYNDNCRQSFSSPVLRYHSLRAFPLVFYSISRHQKSPLKPRPGESVNAIPRAPSHPSHVLHYSILHGPGKTQSRQNRGVDAQCECRNAPPTIPPMLNPYFFIFCNILLYHESLYRLIHRAATSPFNPECSPRQSIHPTAESSDQSDSPVTQEALQFIWSSVNIQQLPQSTLPSACLVNPGCWTAFSFLSDISFTSALLQTDKT